MGPRTLPRGIWIPVLVPAEAGEPALDLLEENLAMAAGAEPAGFVVLGAWSEPEALGPAGRRLLYERTLAASPRPVVLDLRRLAPEEALELVRLAPPAGFLAAEPPAPALRATGLPWAWAGPPAPAAEPDGNGPARPSAGVPLWAESLAALRPAAGEGARRLPEGVVSPASAVAPWQAADLWRAAAGERPSAASSRRLEAMMELERALAGRVARAKLAMELEGYFGGPPLGEPAAPEAGERWAMYTLLLELGLLRGG
ncbi:MAG: hypothetical protein QJR08_09870 [Bacillota bacterium]|nr:hypothetical protein [Bacillota bacterium]